MTSGIETIRIPVGWESMAGAFLSPEARVPGVLFAHGWGGSQQRDLARARGIAGLGCVCLTFDQRGHSSATPADRVGVTREDNLRDLLAAYDRLVAHPAIDTSAIGVVGTSYGGYLGAILTTLRPVNWLALRVPALYRDADWLKPKSELDRADLADYRSRTIDAGDNRALRACAEFRGDVLLVESEHDEHVPHSAIMSYRNAFRHCHSMTHRIIDGADHSLSAPDDQQAYTSLLVNWVTEMVIGKRVGPAPQA